MYVSENKGKLHAILHRGIRYLAVVRAPFHTQLSNLVSFVLCIRMDGRSEHTSHSWVESDLPGCDELCVLFNSELVYTHHTSLSSAYKVRIWVGQR